jgi:hypothetical protein
MLLSWIFLLSSPPQLHLQIMDTFGKKGQCEAVGVQGSKLLLKGNEDLGTS